MLQNKTQSDGKRYLPKTDYIRKENFVGDNIDEKSPISDIDVNEVFNIFPFTLTVSTVDKHVSSVSVGLSFELLNFQSRESPFLFGRKNQYYPQWPWILRLCLYLLGSHRSYRSYRYSVVS